MKFTVLIVDDEKNIREGLKEALSLDGYEVAAAADGKEGRQRLLGARELARVWEGDRQDVVRQDAVTRLQDRELRRSERAPPILGGGDPLLVGEVAPVQDEDVPEVDLVAVEPRLGVGGLDPADLQPLPVALFATFIGLAWRFPFSILPRARMSMEYVFIIASLAVLPYPLPYMAGGGAVILGMEQARFDGYAVRNQIVRTAKEIVK